MNQEKKKVRTLTFHRVLNYGAVLQAYALAKTVRDMGYDCKVADYTPLYFLYQIYRPAKGFKKSYDKLLKILRFSKFRKKYLPMTGRLHLKTKTMEAESGIHAYICGSDQVWNKSITNGRADKGFLIDFETKDARKIAFAASSGGNSLMDDKSYSDILNDYYTIGVRESVLKDDIEKMGMDATVVVDPSLLIKDYSEIMDFTRVPSGDFLLTYVVGSGKTLKQFDDYVGELKKSTGIPVVHIGSKGLSSADISILDIGPSDWISFFEKAKFIVTNSFHGTAFSLNFEKQFIFVPHIKKSLNERQITLLKSVGLLDRAELTCYEYSKYINIDYSIVTPKLARIVDSSRFFLRESLAD